MPVLAPSRNYELEGHPLRCERIGGADGALGTIVHVPELAVVCSGDIAYNNVHMWLWQSTPDSRNVCRLRSSARLAKRRPCASSTKGT